MPAPKKEASMNLEIKTKNLMFRENLLPVRGDATFFLLLATVNKIYIGQISNKNKYENINKIINLNKFENLIFF
jgi:hypothetical protein